jgi:hypothetical protein
MLPVRTFFPALALSALLGVMAVAASPHRRAETNLRRVALRPPVSFEPNLGQAPSGVHFLSRGPGYTLAITDSGAMLALQSAKRGAQTARIGVNQTPTRERQQSLPPSERQTRNAVLRMELVGARARPAVSGTQPLAGRSNYLFGRDPRHWRTHIPTFASVRAAEVYPGIDLLYHGREGRLDHDFIVAPSADPGRVQVRFTGAERAEIGTGGDLLLHTATGTVRQGRPLVYQEVNGDRRPVSAQYVLRSAKCAATEVRFALGPYDHALPLVIDPPLLSFSTYLGGNEGDATDYQFDYMPGGVATDAAGNVYVTGTTYAPDFPTTPGAFQTDRVGGADVFISKLSADGTQLIYSTLLGGDNVPGGSDSAGTGIAVDSMGCAYATGWTDSPDFPTRNPLQGPAGGFDAFVTKLSADGSSLVYSTFLGGGNEDIGFGIALDPSNNAYVTGRTYSVDFPVVNALRASGGSPDWDADGFVTKVAADGSHLVYSTYLGGHGYDYGHRIYVDANGRAYVGGSTYSLDFPVTAGAVQTTHADDRNSDGFIAALDETGAVLRYSTYLGGHGFDEVNGIAVDSAGSAYVTGTTWSTDFPLRNPLQSQLGGFNDAFVAKLTRDGSALVYSTYLGGRGNDWGACLVLDEAGSAYVTGNTNSHDFPVANPLSVGARLHDNPINVFYDGVVVKVNPAGTGLEYSTYLGGTDYDLADNIAVTPQHAAVILGQTRSFDLPISPNAYQPNLGGFLNPFVTAIGEGRADPGARWHAAPLQLRFPTTHSGSTSTLLLHLINAGPGRVTVNFGQPAPPFSTGPTDPVTLEPKQVATVGVSFSPSRRGTAHSALQLISYYPTKRVVTVSLTGSGR